MSRGPRITKFCHLFLDGDDQYVFLKNLGQGFDSQAQLVLHVQTSEMRVRKVSHKHLDYKATKIEDPEKVLFSLQTQAAKRGVQPHISRLYSASDVRGASTGENRALWSRVSYTKFYNGGTVGDLCRACMSIGQPVPSTTIWRIMTQIVDALQFMRTCGEGVLHYDIHGEQIFLHYDGAKGGVPDFYLGDFGNAQVQGDLKDPNEYRKDVKDLRCFLKLLLLVERDGEPEEQDELWQYLYFNVRAALKDLRPTSSLPDLKPIIKILRDAPAGPPESLPAWLDTRDEYAGLPLFYTYEDECLDVVGVAGPWHVAKVSIDVHKRLFTVLKVSPETYSSAVP